MVIKRRDVVNVIFGSNTRENHLAIVLSPEEVNSEEEQFLGIMITDSKFFDPNNDCSFPITDEMFINPLKEKSSRVRLFLLNFLPNQCIVGNARVNEMRIEPFKAMIKELNTKIFGV